MNKANINNSLNINLFPNPVTDILTITRSENTSIITEIYSLLGQKIYACELKDKNTNIDFSNFINGMYIVLFISESGTSTYKVIKK